MSLELRVPAVGESITEVQIGDWLKQEGQAVRKDENLVLIESEKATIELPSPADGQLSRILRRRGEIAKVGEVIAEIEAGGAARAPAAPAAPATTTSDAASAPVVMPAAQRILEAAGVAPETVPGTGPKGRVTKEDAQRAVAALDAGAASEKGVAPGSPAPAPAEPKAETAPAGSPPEPAPASPPPPPAPVSALAAEPDEELVPMSPLRRTVARRLVEAQATMAMLTTFNEIDMSRVMALRKAYQDAFVARHGVKLGFMSFFVKAVIEALKQVPQLNGEIREPNLVFHRTYDIGVAIGGGKGLVVPVIRRAECLGFAQIEQVIADFAVRAREGRLKPDELQGGTFTITNGGIYGSLLSTPIINPPQSGILGMHTIQDRPVVVDGQIVVRPMMYVALTYDHRMVDGREAVTFLKRVKEIIEDPARMLLEA